MARDQKRMAKTQSLSLRLDPKTKFILEFIARIRAQSITAVVERAIKETAERVGVGPEWDERGNQIEQKIWSNFWDASEGVRTLNLLSDPNYPTTYDEDELRAFTMAHWQFFYLDQKGDVPRRGYIEILWAEKDKYLDIWREKKTENYWAAGKSMKSDLAAAHVASPDWPPPSPAKSQPSSKSVPGDLDDDIPF